MLARHIRLVLALPLLLGLVAPAGAQTKIRSFGTGVASNTLCMAFSRDGKQIAAPCPDGFIHVWETDTGKELHKFTNESAWSVSFSPDGKYLAAPGSDASVRILDLKEGKEKARLKGLVGTLWSLGFSGSGNQVAAGAGGTVMIFDADTEKTLHTIDGITDGVWSMDFSADGSTVVVGGAGGTIHVIDAKKGKVERQIATNQGGIWPAVVSSDARTIASIRYVGDQVQLWDTASGKEKRTVAAGTGSAWVLAFSPDGRTVACPSADNKVALIEVATGQVRASLGDGTARADSIAFAPDGKSVLVGSNSGELSLYDVTGLADDKGKPKDVKLAAKDLAACWADLQGGDADKAHQAIWKLAADPKATLPFLPDQFKGKPAGVKPDEERIVKLVAQLDADDFNEREKATEELTGIGKAAVPHLRKALENKPSAEQRRRIDELLEKFGGGKDLPKNVAPLRAIEALERINTPEAVKVLEGLAKEPPDPMTEEEAKAAVKRMKARK